MTNYSSCTSCGQTVLKGAMRCSRCGRLQKTPEEQAALLKKIQEPKKFSINIVKLIKILVMFGAAWIIYANYSNLIQEYIDRLFSN